MKGWAITIFTLCALHVTAAFPPLALAQGMDGSAERRGAREHRRERWQTKTPQERQHMRRERWRNATPEEQDRMRERMNRMRSEGREPGSGRLGEGDDPSLTRERVGEFESRHDPSPRPLPAELRADPSITLSGLEIGFAPHALATVAGAPPSRYRWIWFAPRSTTAAK
jgi:hypothetical protein